MDWLTFGIAIWGAVLATAIGIYELLKDRRKISIYLEYVLYGEKYRMVVVNTGHRAVTLTNITLLHHHYKDGNLAYTDPVPASVFFEEPQDYRQWPATLKDGEQMIYYFSDVIRDAYLAHDRIEVRVYDAEEHVWKTGKTRVFDQKLGGYQSP